MSPTTTTPSHQQQHPNQNDAIKTNYNNVNIISSPATSSSSTTTASESVPKSQQPQQEQQPQQCCQSIRKKMASMWQKYQNVKSGNEEMQQRQRESYFGGFLKSSGQYQRSGADTNDNKDQNQQMHSNGTIGSTVGKYHDAEDSNGYEKTPKG